ncbi:Saf4/Yju2 family protein [Aspergillus alliaceus]|uniref:Saf4/Yju2 family protein n=1 Tax=Petromyces alliaceus TaxID=209559 RepID=UPI0012A73F26|nr:CWC16 protein [Aspergillus alliaceus]KAB8235004.1 CWC16 protein [Aspergillus alliaceus]
MGRYVPPDQEGLMSGNQLAKKHPLGARARHLHTTGALTVRFEMPFAVWCTTCKPHETIIGQGVRFNAEKKKIGNYHSTPIYSFRMRHPACGGWIEIRTDPKNTAYVVAEGGRKRDTGEERRGDGEIVIKLPGERREEVSDPFARLEGKVEDKKVVDEGRTRILELQERQSRDWDDPYEMSRRLRRTFRAERKTREGIEAKREALKDKMSLGIDIVDETEEDRLRAGLVDFSTGNEATAARTRPMFETKGVSTEKSKPGKRKKTADLVAERKAMFRNELTGNTRAVIDPFLNHDGSTWQPEVKRRKAASNKADMNKPDNQNQDNADSEGGVSSAPQEHSTEVIKSASKTPEPSIALVAYASDSE